jgi:putative flavoprotein involved in K+ transport
MVAEGRIKLAHGQVDHLTETSVVLAAGTELPADLVVYATGYGSMNGWVADIVDQETADRVGKVWGLGSDTPKDPGPWEGEQRNMWKPHPAGEPVVPRRQPAPVPALLAVPRAPAQGRYEGLDTPVYALQASHHAS